MKNYWKKMARNRSEWNLIEEKAKALKGPGSQ
jgi:hypothetical protein